MSKTKSWAASVLLAMFAILLSFSFVACASARKPHQNSGAAIVENEVDGKKVMPNVYFDTENCKHTSSQSDAAALTVDGVKAVIATNTYALKYNGDSVDTFKVKLSVYGANPVDTNGKQTSSIWSIFYNHGITEYAIKSTSDYSAYIRKENTLPTKAPDVMKKISEMTSEQKTTFENSFIVSSPSGNTYRLTVKNSKGQYAVIQWVFGKPSTDATA